MKSIAQSTSIVLAVYSTETLHTHTRALTSDDIPKFLRDGVAPTFSALTAFACVMTGILPRNMIAVAIERQTLEHDQTVIVETLAQGNALTMGVVSC